MGQQVHLTDPEAVDHRFDIGHQLGKPVARPVCGTSGFAGSAHVVGNEVVAVEKMFGHPVPHVVVVGIAVDRQHGRAARIDLGVGVYGQVDAVGRGQGGAGGHRRSGGHEILVV